MINTFTGIPANHPAMRHRKPAMDAATTMRSKRYWSHEPIELNQRHQVFKGLNLRDIRTCLTLTPNSRNLVGQGLSRTECNGHVKRLLIQPPGQVKSMEARTPMVSVTARRIL